MNTNVTAAKQLGSFILGLSLTAALASCLTVICLLADKEWTNSIYIYIGIGIISFGFFLQGIKTVRRNETAYLGTLGKAPVFVDPYYQGFYWIPFWSRLETNHNAAVLHSSPKLTYTIYSRDSYLFNIRLQYVWYISNPESAYSSFDLSMVETKIEATINTFIRNSSSLSIIEDSRRSKEEILMELKDATESVGVSIKDVILVINPDEKDQLRIRENRQKYEALKFFIEEESEKIKLRSRDPETEIKNVAEIYERLKLKPEEALDCLKILKGQFDRKETLHSFDVKLDGNTYKLIEELMAFLTKKR